MNRFIDILVSAIGWASLACLAAGLVLITIGGLRQSSRDRY